MNKSITPTMCDEMEDAWADDADEEPGWDLYGYDEE